MSEYTPSGFLAGYERHLTESITAAREVSERMTALRGSAETPDGLVRAEATAAGRLTALRLDPRAMRLDSQTLAETILATATAASEDAGRQAAALATGAGDTAPTWDDLLNGVAEPDPDAPLPPMPDPATFEQMIADAARRRGV